LTAGPPPPPPPPSYRVGGVGSYVKNKKNSTEPSLLTFLRLCSRDPPPATLAGLRILVHIHIITRHGTNGVRIGRGRDRGLSGSYPGWSIRESHEPQCRFRDDHDVDINPVHCRHHSQFIMFPPKNPKTRATRLPAGPGPPWALMSYQYSGTHYKNSLGVKRAHAVTPGFVSVFLSVRRRRGGVQRRTNVAAVTVAGGGSGRIGEWYTKSA